MQQEYQKTGVHQRLRKMLWKNYFLRILPGIIAITAIFVYFSGIFTTNYLEYSVKAASFSSSALEDIIKATQYSLKTINYALSKQIKMQKTKETPSEFYSQFRCVAGNCSEAAALRDYIWTFKLRNPFIDYIILEYTSSQSSINRLVMSSLDKLTLLKVKTGKKNWLLSYNNSKLCLSYQQNASIVLGMACFDSKILQTKYKIIIEDYKLALESSFSGLAEISFQDRAAENYGFDVIPINLAVLAGLLAVLLLNHFKILHIVSSWEERNFKHVEALQSIYQEQLKQIFSSQQPRNSAVLNQSTLECFYEDLSEMVDGSYCSLSEYHVQEEELQKFKYLGLLQRIKERFQQEMKVVLQQKIDQLADIRFQLKAPLAEICDNVAKRLKEHFTRAKELNLTTAFFYYGYLALIMPIDRYEERLQKETLPMPEPMLALFRYINSSINSEDIKFAFKFHFQFNKNIEDELIMRLHFALQQKYTALVKELDFENHFARTLGLQKELKYVEESIENKKYILTSYLK